MENFPHHQDDVHVEFVWNDPYSDYIYLYILGPLLVIVAIVVICFAVREGKRKPVVVTRRGPNAQRPRCARNNTQQLNVASPSAPPAYSIYIPPPPPYQEQAVRSPDGLPPPPPYTR